jgi:hypothetical protein
MKTLDKDQKIIEAHSALYFYYGAQLYVIAYLCDSLSEFNININNN